MTNLAVLFGGKSTEHDISIMSGTSIISNLDKEKYNIYPIYIDKEGKNYRYAKNIKSIKPLTIGDPLTDLEPIDNIFK